MLQMARCDLVALGLVCCLKLIYMATPGRFQQDPRIEQLEARDYDPGHSDSDQKVRFTAPITDI